MSAAYGRICVHRRGARGTRQRTRPGRLRCCTAGAAHGARSARTYRRGVPARACWDAATGAGLVAVDRFSTLPLYFGERDGRLALGDAPGARVRTARHAGRDRPAGALRVRLVPRDSGAAVDLHRRRSGSRSGRRWRSTRDRAAHALALAAAISTIASRSSFAAERDGLHGRRCARASRSASTTCRASGSGASSRAAPTARRSPGWSPRCSARPREPSRSASTSSATTSRTTRGSRRSTSAPSTPSTCSRPTKRERTIDVLAQCLRAAVRQFVGGADLRVRAHRARGRRDAHARRRRRRRTLRRQRALRDAVAALALRPRAVGAARRGCSSRCSSGRLKDVQFWPVAQGARLRRAGQRRRCPSGSARATTCSTASARPTCFRTRCLAAPAASSRSLSSARSGRAATARVADQPAARLRLQVHARRQRPAEGHPDVPRGGRRGRVSDARRPGRASIRCGLPPGRSSGARSCATSFARRCAGSCPTRSSTSPSTASACRSASGCSRKPRLAARADDALAGLAARGLIRTRRSSARLRAAIHDAARRLLRDDGLGADDARAVDARARDRAASGPRDRSRRGAA